VDVCIQANEQILDQVIASSDEAWSPFNFQSDGISLVNANPDGQHCIAPTSFRTTIGMLVTGSIINREFSSQLPSHFLLSLRSKTAFSCVMRRPAAPVAVEVEMKIRGLMMDPVTNMPIVVLKMLAAIQCCPSGLALRG